LTESSPPIRSTIGARLTPAGRRRIAAILALPYGIRSFSPGGESDHSARSKQAFNRFCACIAFSMLSNQLNLPKCQHMAARRHPSAAECRAPRFSAASARPSYSTAFSTHDGNH
jgi:hypothetical protein